MAQTATALSYVVAVTEVNPSPSVRPVQEHVRSYFTGGAEVGGEAGFPSMGIMGSTMYVGRAAS